MRKRKTPDSPKAAKKMFSWKVLAGCLLLAALMRLPSLDLPLDRDEGEYATLAQQWSRGEVLPYRDLADLKPPLAPLVDRAAFLGGETVFSIRLAALAWQMATAAAFYFLAALLLCRWEALAAVVLFILFSCGARLQGLGANAESYTTLPLVIGLIALARPARKWFWFGLGAGVAGLAKQPALVPLVLFPLFLGQNPKDKAKAFGLALLGAALPWSAAAAYFSAHGGGSDMFFCLVTYPMSYAMQGWGGFASNLLAACRNLAPEQAGLWLAALAGLLVAAPTKRRFFGAWLAAALVGTAMPGRFFPNYFVLMSAPLAVLGALGLGPLWEKPFKLPRLRFVLAALCLAAIGAGWYHTTGGLYRASNGAERSRKMYGLDNFADAPATAAVIAQADPKGSRLWIWGNEAELYFLTGRRPAGRFLFIYPFTGEAPAWPDGDGEMLRSLDDPALTMAVLPKNTFPDSSRPLQALVINRLAKNFFVIGHDDDFMLAIRRVPPVNPPEPRP